MIDSTVFVDASRGELMIGVRSKHIVPSEGTDEVIGSKEVDGTKGHLTNLQLRLCVVRRQMHDLAQWHREQSDEQSIPAALLSAVQHAMDKLSDEATQLCGSMSEAPAKSVADLKHKALALEYLLPEDADAHTVLCRSICSDILRM